MRSWHYWRKAKRTTAPANICAIDTETWQEKATCGDAGARLTWRLGCATAFRIEGARTTRHAYCEADTPEELLRFICSRLNARMPLWLIAHNLPFDLKVARLWPVLCSGRFTCSFAAISPGCTYIKGKLDGFPIILADTFNWWKQSIRDIGSTVGLGKLPTPDADDGAGRWASYCMQDAEICAAAFVEWTRFVRENDLGPFAATAAGQSFRALQRRWLSHQVLVHCNDAALRLERESYYGGIVETSYVGGVREHGITECDVQSMYPSVCLAPLPIRILGHGERVGLENVRRRIGEGSVIARVDIDTPDVPFPVRMGGRTVHATGEFSTTLAGPELREAFRLGVVRRVREAARYQDAPVFREAMTALLDLRRRLEGEGRAAHAQMAKGLANALYGKTAQRSVMWQRWEKPAFDRIAANAGLPAGCLDRHAARPPRLVQMEEKYLIPQYNLSLNMRDYWGYVEVEVDWGESRDSVPAIAACVTSEARLVLRGYQREAGARHWYYSDTDSLWVDNVGLHRLYTSGAIAPGVPGRLSVRRQADSLTIHGPKDYVADGERVCKGAKAKATWEADHTYSQDHFPGPRALLNDIATDGVLVKRIRRTLHRKLMNRVQGPDGWTRPFRLPEDSGRTDGSCLDGHEGGIV